MKFRIFATKEKAIMTKNKKSIICCKDLYDENGVIVFPKGMIYAISEDGKTYYSHTVSVPNPFQVISDICDIRDAKESYPKDEYGGLFKLQFSWTVTPSSGGSSCLDSETVIKAFDSGHECAEYIESHITQIISLREFRSLSHQRLEGIVSK